MKLIVLWLFSSVFWGNHGGNIGPGWYLGSVHEAVVVCAIEGVAATSVKGIEAFLCQPENFPRPEPVAEAK